VSNLQYLNLFYDSEEVLSISSSFQFCTFLLFSIMNVKFFSHSDLVMVIGGKYKGSRAIVVELKPQMVEMKLLLSSRQVRVMFHNVSSIPEDEKKIGASSSKLITQQ